MSKRALVTGAEGFIGSHLVEALLIRGYEVRAFVLYNSFSQWGWLDRLPPQIRQQIEIFPGDIQDPGRVAAAMEDMDFVFHLAALISIPYSYHSPASYVSVNVQGTLHVLEAAKHNPAQRILITSSSEVYGTAQYIPIDEQHPLQAQSPYSASKIGAESLAHAYWSSFETAVSIVRPFNTYGPRQSARAILPAIILQLLHGVEALQLGDLRPTRDLMYVQDTVQAMIHILESEQTIGEIINIASGKEWSIGELAQKLIDQIRPGTPIVQDPRRLRPSKSEVLRLLGSSQKLQSLVEWKPQTTLDEGLKSCIAWYRQPENQAGFNTDQYYV